MQTGASAVPVLARLSDDFWIRWHRHRVGILPDRDSARRIDGSPEPTELAGRGDSLLDYPLGAALFAFPLGTVPCCRQAEPVFFFVFACDSATLQLGRMKPPADLAVLWEIEMKNKIPRTPAAASRARRLRVTEANYVVFSSS